GAGARSHAADRVRRALARGHGLCPGLDERGDDHAGARVTNSLLAGVSPRSTGVAARSRPGILALDIGTSSCKGAVFTPDGVMLATARQEYPTWRLRDQRIEQVPADWWHAVQDVCRELTASDRVGEIVVVGLSGQVPTMVLVDDEGRALTPAISWQDRRAGDEAAWLREHAGAERMAEWFGMDLPIDPGWPPARLLWWRRNAPDIVAKA